MTLIDANYIPNCFDHQSFKVHETESHYIFYRGLAYIPGLAADNESISELARRLADETLDECSHILKGIYGIFVYNQLDRTLSVINDHTGLYKIFYDKERISTGLLELARSKPRHQCHIDDHALIEFIAHGSVAGPRTFVNEIQQLKGDQVLHLNLEGNGQPHIVLSKKYFPTPTTSVTTKFSDLIHEMDTALSHRTITADLTGGLDTRLLFSCLHKTGLDYELGVSGRQDSEDVRIARLAAKLVNKELLVKTHQIQPAGIEFDQELEALFEIGDGQTDPLRFHRIHQHTLDRNTRKIDVNVHGGGGEIYKDFHWLQDFPFLGIRKPNYRRYYSLRVAALSPRKLLTESGLSLLESVQATALRSYEQFGEKNNIRGYLNVYSFIRSPEFYGRTFSNHINLGLDIFAPYLERSNIVAGMNLPVWQRLMNGWHRHVIQQNFPALAALETTEGYSAVSGIKFISQLPKYVQIQIRRVARKIGQKLFGKSWFLELGADANNDRDLYERARKGALAPAALNRVVKRGLIKKAVTPDEIGNIHLGRLITLGLFLREFDS